MLLIPAVMYTRVPVEVLIAGLDVAFLVRSARRKDWSWLRAPWARLAAALWVWLVLCSLASGVWRSIGQSLMLVRLPLLVAALETWVLAEAPARRVMQRAALAAIAWVALETWQQWLTGHNLFGTPRFGDGALTGPFTRPVAGATLMQLMFPALLPPVLALLARPARWAPVAAALLLALAVATQVLIGQRMPTLLVLLGLATGTLLIRRARLPVLAAVAAGAALLAASPLISPGTYHKLVVQFSEQMAHFPESDYGLLFQRAAVMLAAHPWIGLGFDGFRLNCADPAYDAPLRALGLIPPGTPLQGGCNLHPHNYWLDIGVSGGVPGLLLFAGLAGALLSRMFGGLRAMEQPQRAALAIAVLITLWPVASTSAMFTLPTAGWVFLLFGWGLAETRR